MSRRRLTLDEVREALGDEAIGLSDLELIELREHAFEFSEIFIERAYAETRAAAEATRARDQQAFHEAMSGSASRD